MMNIQSEIKPKRYLGFTLIELMIVVSVVGILSAVALPSFLDQIRKSRRAEAMSAALECATIQERRFTLRNDYEDDACDTLSDGLEHYQIAVTHPDDDCQADNGNDTCFLVTVTPLAASSQADDAACTGFTLTDLGVRGATGADADSCWRD